MNLPPITIETWTYSILQVFLLCLYIYLMVPIVRRTFKEKHPNRFSNLALLFVLGTIAILYILPFSQWGFYAAYPISYWSAVFLAAWTLVTLIGWRTMKPSSERASNLVLEQGLDKTNKDNIDTHNFGYGGEVRRKVLHVMALITLFAFAVGHMVFWLVNDFAYATMQSMVSVDIYASLAWLDAQPEYIQGALIFNLGTFGAFTVQANCEILRLRYPKVNFAFKRTMQKTRRASETRSFGAHMSLIPSFLLGGMILTYWTPEAEQFQGVMATFAVVAVSALADMAAAMIGRKYGKHKWKIVKGKSIEGTLAGSITAFFAAIVFVGPVLALVAVLVFNFTDIALAKVRISDNLTNPLLLAIVFRLLLFLCQPLLPALWYIPEWM